jgi:hypothetical protein
MNRKNKGEEVSGALLGIVLVFLIIAFILFKLFKQDEIVENKNIQINTENKEKEEFEYKSQVYKEYLEKLENIKKESGASIDAENKLAQEMTEKVLKATTFEKSNLEVKYSSFDYSKTKYQENINKILSEAKKKGMGEEMKIFILQAQSSQLDTENKSLELSDSDKEYLIYIAKAYEYFGSHIEVLQTPTEYLNVGNSLLNKSFDVATILKKMATEEDPLINAIWFARYADAVKIFYQSNKNSNI